MFLLTKTNDLIILNGKFQNLLEKMRKKIVIKVGQQKFSR